MSSFRFLDGISRKALVAEVNANITDGASRDYGQFRTSEFTKFAGLWSTVGSLTLRIRSGVSSGVFQVTSTMAVNSGVAVFDFPNYAQWTYLDITAANSTVYSLLVQGEALR